MADAYIDPSDGIFEAASVGIVALGQDGRIARANPALAAMFGYEPGELIGAPLEVLLPDELRAAHSAHRRAYMLSPRLRRMGGGLDLVGRRKDGQIFPIEASLSALRVGGHTLSVAFVVDVSERKRLERERDELLAQERRSRAAAELAQRRVAFLAEASRVLAASLDYETALSKLAEIVLPFLGDGCAIDLLVDGRLQRAAAGHVIPAKAALMEEAQRRFPSSLDLPRPARAVIETGRPILNAEVTEQMLARSSTDPEQLAIYLRLGVRSSMTVPLVVRGRILGVIGLIITEGERRYGPDDQSLAEELALSAAQAIENARLFRAAEESRALVDALVQSAPIGVAFLDRGLRYQLVNAHLAEMNGLAPEAHIGQTVAELLPDLAPSVEPLFRRVLESDEPYINLEISGETPAMPGVERTWMASYFPVHEAGAVIGVGLSVLEITDRRRAEEDRRRRAAFTRLLQVVAVAANEATSPRAALQTAVDQICATIGWPVGHVYLAVDGAPSSLSTTDIWHFDDPARFATFRTITEAVAAGPEDLPGLVLISGQPEWVADIAALGAAPRFGLIAELGLRSGFAFPVLVGAEVAAVLEFFAPAPQPPDLALLEVVGHVGAQLGRVIERTRAEVALRASEALYRTLASNLPNGSVLLFDHDLRYTIADGQALHRAGMSRASVEGHTLHEVLAPERAAALEPFYRDALAGTMAVHEWSTPERTYLVHFLPVRDEAGAIVAGMVMSWDITQLKQAEQALIEERSLLERRIEERTGDLSAANAELARAARLKDEFLASMSHELRTPLNAVLGLSEALREQVYGPLGDRQDRAVAIIEESGRHLLELINDILDLAKIGAGKMMLAIEEVSLEQICEASVRIVREAALKKTLGLHVTLDSRVKVARADPRRLKQILVNLLSNAVKFTPAGGSVGLSVEADPDQGRLSFTVWDTGIGIEPDQLERLFQPFVQLDSRLARRYSGTGLGLALVYGMCELHGGSIRVTSTPGEGSRFVVDLPWSEARVEQDAAEAEAASPFPPTLRRALIVEDSPTAASQLLRYLGELNISTTVIPEGNEALARATETSPDLIVLDILLPDTSGWQVLERLKADPRTAAIPVVIVSVVDDKDRGQALGAAGYVVKPYARADILRALQQLQPAAAGPRGAAAGEAREGGLILVAEDNEANSMTTVDFLDALGYRTSVARDGAEAVARAFELRPALILMDIQMPGMDGLEATRRIRADPSMAQTPIIALTALAMPGDRERCLQAGADDYLSKPVSLKRLGAVIGDHLDPKRKA